MAVESGSAMDVAKCVKLYADLPGDGRDGSWLKSEIIPNSIPIPSDAHNGRNRFGGY